MVLKRRLDYGFSGYEVPIVPRSPRSIRRRCLHKKPVEDTNLCAFELLAAVAGKFLQESESSTSSNAAVDKDKLLVKKNGVKLERTEEDKACGSENHDRGSCVYSALVTEPAAHEYSFKSKLKELPHVKSDIVLENVSPANSYFSKDVGSHVKLELCTSKNAVENFPRVAQRGSSDNGVSCVADTGNASPKDAMELCVNTPTIIKLNTSVQLPLYGDHIPTSSSATDIDLGVRDDDKKIFRRNKPRTNIWSFRSQSHVRQRVRKFLTSKCWKVAPRSKDFDLSHTDGEMRPFDRNTKNISTPERCEREAPFKKRKLFVQSSSTVYDADASGKSIPNSPDMGFKGNLNYSATFPQKVAKISSSVGHPAFFQPKDSYVKLSIKSFRVPQLYIEVPETATIGSLKKMVLKAVSTVLGGGLRVGVLLQGKKVKGDNRTLLQTGISHCGNLDLGFTLEPSFKKAPPVPKDAPSLLRYDAHQEVLRTPTHSILESGFSNTSFDPCPVKNMDNHVKSDCEVFPSYNGIQMNEAASDSKALVPIPELNTEALPIVPINQRPKRSKFSQRRSRRPFTVPEVEALVEAVEQLGTGRWRDVKMHAFDNADHRTYVDLKDKWKTLVHTASISHWQRRGEPVPQELLDRVLAAHAFWSRHQSKQHGRPQAEPFKI